MKPKANAKIRLRKEKFGYVLVTPYYNLVVNSAGRKILKLCNGRKDIKRISKETGIDECEVSKFVEKLRVLEVLE